MLVLVYGRAKLKAGHTDNNEEKYDDEPSPGVAHRQVRLSVLG